MEKEKKKKLVHKKRSIRCCYVTVDFATAASEIGISIYCNLHKETNVIRKITKNFRFLFISNLIIEQ